MSGSLTVGLTTLICGVWLAPACGQGACISGAFLGGALPISTASEHQIDGQVCVNGSCSQFSELLPPADGAGAMEEWDYSGAVSWRFFYDLDEGAWLLTVHLKGNYIPESGDLYTFELQADGQTVVSYRGGAPLEADSSCPRVSVNVFDGLGR